VETKTTWEVYSEGSGIDKLGLPDHMVGVLRDCFYAGVVSAARASQAEDTIMALRQEVDAYMDEIHAHIAAESEVN
jgi:hypothetical protein